MHSCVCRCSLCYLVKTLTQKSRVDVCSATSTDFYVATSTATEVKIRNHLNNLNWRQFEYKNRNPLRNLDRLELVVCIELNSSRDVKLLSETVWFNSRKLLRPLLCLILKLEPAWWMIIFVCKGAEM